MAITEINQIDAIGKEGNKLRLMIIDFLDWKYEDLHLEMLQDKINNYLTFIESKQYISEYGDCYEEKIIDIYFQEEITENCSKFLNVISSKIKEEKIYICIHLPK